MADWGIIRADFLATGMSYPQLAKKYGVSISTLKKKAAREHWTGKKDSVDLLVVREPEPEEPREPREPGEPGEPELTCKEIVEARRSRAERFMKVTDTVLDRIDETLQSEDVKSPYALKLLSSALRDVRDMLGLNRTALDIEEQMARIAKLRQDVQIVDTGSQGVTVEFVDTYGAED